MFLGVIVFCVAMTLAMSKLLSATVLRRTALLFSLELPPYRLPQVGRVLVRSLLDRTVVVLGRALTVTMPGGLIWGWGPHGRRGVVAGAGRRGTVPSGTALMGLDGMVLLAFFLAFPPTRSCCPFC